MLSVVLILFLLYIGSTIIIPLLFAVFISVILFPLTRFFESIGMWRSLAAFISIILFLLALTTVIYFLSQQVVSFSKDIPTLEAKLTETLHHFQHWIYVHYRINNTQQMSYLSKSASNILNNVTNSVGNIFLYITNTIIWIIFTIIYTFFMLYHRKLMVRFLLALFRPQDRTQVLEVIMETKSVINSYILGLLIEMGIVATLNSVILALLGVPYSLFIGILAAILNIIPYLGIYTATALSLLITFASGTTTQVLETGLVLISIHIFDANIMMPRIVGGRVKMNPFITIVAVLLGDMLWGIPGMFLFIPLTAIIKIISERVEALKPWAILIGEEPRENDRKKK